MNLRKSSSPQTQLLFLFLEPWEGTMRRISLAIIAFGLVAAACSSDSTDTTVEVTDPPSATTTSQAPTTTKAPIATTTTTAPATTTTTGPAVEMVPATPLFGVLEP
jgi:PBP1b-binding outer membrane lipoprotein LpoB